MVVARPEFIFRNRLQKDPLLLLATLLELELTGTVIKYCWANLSSRNRT